jgi:hypothetical protein
VSTPGYQPVELYLRDALRQELSRAGLYAEDSRVTLKINFINVSMITAFAGRWYITGEFSWNDEAAFRVEHRHDYEYQFEVVMACGSAASEFVPAVRGFVGAVFAHPGFKKGMRPGQVSPK